MRARAGQPADAAAGPARAGGFADLYYATDASFAGFTTATVDGGSGEHPAALGTIAFINTSTNALRVSQSLAFPTDSALTFGSVTVDSGATLSIGSGSTLTVQNAFTVTDNSTVVLGARTVGR